LVINIADHGGPIVWEGIYYFALSEYPKISDWELRNILLFMDYEKKHNRKTEIVCEDKGILDKVNYAIANPLLFLSTTKPDIITYTVCTECRFIGCLTDFLCHTSSIDDAKSIFKCGQILSAIKARNKTGLELSKEPRNAAKDTPDYFEYIMFSWGNCKAGDSLVMERMLGRFPDKNDLTVGFKPGVRFYFKYEDILKHKNYENDGHHPAKIKDEISLFDYLYCCIIPKDFQDDFLEIIPKNLENRVFSIENDCKGIMEWTEKVYNYVCKKNK
jgi:hypothetical protein